MSNEHMDVSVTQRQTLSIPLVLQTIAMLGGLGGVYANGVANDREFATKLTAQQAQIEQLQVADRTFKSDLRADLREIKQEIRDLRDEVNDKRRK